jgi:hypothetical protein
MQVFRLRLRTMKEFDQVVTGANDIRFGELDLLF